MILSYQLTSHCYVLYFTYHPVGWHRTNSLHTLLLELGRWSCPQDTMGGSSSSNSSSICCCCM